MVSGSEMKYTYFHYFSLIKTQYNAYLPMFFHIKVHMSIAANDVKIMQVELCISRITKVILKNCPKKGKYDPFDCKKMNFQKNKHNAELQRTDPGTKVTGEFSTRGHIFSPNVWN